MENNIIKNETGEELNKTTIKRLLLCAGISIFWVLFLWNFWDKGVYVLGMNAFVFLSLFLLLFVWKPFRNGNFSKTDFVWLLPLTFIVLSYLIYDNPFLKLTNILVFPVAFTLFYNYAFLDNKKKIHWDIMFFISLLRRALSFFEKIGGTLSLYIEMLIPAGKEKRKIISKVISGIILFLIIAFTIFIPLLSSADAVFAGKMQGIIDFIKEVFSVPVVYKIITVIIFSVLLSSVLVAWGKRFDYVESAENEKKIDSIVSGIVLGGILALYLLFLWVQIERLWVGTLPFDFRETEHMVKSGFWQLFFLSIINILIYFFTYRKTNPLVQWILSGFSFASLLLLASAGYRMGLYVINYGLSYEKFFASYTVLYTLILFVWLISRLFINKRANIIKFVVFLFIWMYGLLVLLPVEQIVMRTNVKLAERAESRINLFELTMLSPDVLSLVRKYESSGALKQKNITTPSELEQGIESGWNDWIKRQETIVKDKKWYEKNLMNYFIN